MKRIIYTVSLAALAAFLAVGIGMAAAPITLQPGESITITAAGGPATPPVTCPDGSVHPAGYVCPVTPPPITEPPIAGALEYTIPYARQVIYSSGFKDQLLIGILHVPATGTLTGGSTISIFEYGTNPVDRQAWLSKTKGDTSGVSYNSSAPQIEYSIGGTKSVVMHPGETWYLMVKNQWSYPWAPSVVMPSCSLAGGCNIGIEWYPAVD